MHVSCFWLQARKTHWVSHNETLKETCNVNIVSSKVLSFIADQPRHQELTACSRYVSFVSELLFYFFFFLFRAAPRARAGSQARGLKSEPQLLAYTTTTPDPSRVRNLHHSPQQHHIINPLSEARDRTGNLMVPSWIHFH